MIYVHEMTVSANVTKDSLQVETIKLAACTIRRVMIDFPRGCYYLVGMRIMLREHQLYPTTPDAWLIADGTQISFNDETSLIESPWQLDMEAYNLDERYSHTIRVYLDVDLLSPAGSSPYVPDVYSGYV